MQFLKVMPSARATALGEAYSVWSTGAEAVFWNPAGLATLNNIELSSTYTDWLFDAQQGALSCGFEIQGFGVIGIQVQYVDFGEFEEATNERPYISDPENPGLTGRTFRPFSYLAGVSYARYLRQGVFDEVETWANGLLFDFGIRYDTGYRSVQIGSSIQNFGADVKYAQESNPVPLLFRFGIGADLIGPEGLLYPGSEGNRLSVAYDIFHPNDYAQQMHVGVEYELGGVLALRGGYKFNYDYDGLTLGAGIKHALEGVRLAVDYSYGDMGTYLGHIQRISLGITLP
jgi:hypothetical protein